jgi:hypothetical protein
MVVIVGKTAAGRCNIAPTPTQTQMRSHIRPGPSVRMTCLPIDVAALGISIRASAP